MAAVIVQRKPDVEPFDQHQAKADKRHQAEGIVRGGCGEVGHVGCGGQARQAGNRRRASLRRIAGINNREQA